MPSPALHQLNSSQIKVGKCDKKKISKDRAGLIIPLGQSVSNHAVQAPKRIELEGLGKRRTERAIGLRLRANMEDDHK